MAAAEENVARGALEVRPLSGALGCEIAGVDLATLSTAEFSTIHRAFLDYSVLLFHDQELSQEQFADFGRRFGKLEDEPFLPFKADVPGVFYVKGGPGGKQRAVQNLDWHTDHTYQKNPSLGAILYALDIPPAGGDTLFASNYRAYDSLSPEVRQFVERLTAIHDVLHYGMSAFSHLSVGTEEGLDRLLKMRKRFPQVEHPVVCKHPETGRKMLYLNKAWVTAIKGLKPIESRAILAMLNEHALTPEFQCRIRWRKKSLVIWDNRCVQHRPTADYTEDRLMMRVAIHSDWEPGRPQSQ